MMIAAISGPTSAPAPVLPLPPSVARVAAVEPATSGVGIGADGDGGRRPSAGPAQAALAGGKPPEPLSTASVLLLRQNGSSLSGIADAYGISVDAVRRLLHAEEGPTLVTASALQEAQGAA